MGLGNSEKFLGMEKKGVYLFRGDRFIFAAFYFKN